MRFLIIDDSSVDRRYLAGLVEHLGHQVDQCETAKEALALVESGQYDLVFLDVVMPDQDGYKFLRSLRMNPVTADQYVVFCSTKKTSLEINYGIRRAGANDYLTKPVSHDAVNQVLERLVA
ncbi:MAG: response regulator [Cyanobacteria bacterium P01_F01_bin.42]